MTLEGGVFELIDGKMVPVQRFCTISREAADDYVDVGYTITGLTANGQFILERLNGTE